METQKKTRGTFQSKPQQTASKTREQFCVWAANAELKTIFLVSEIFGYKRGKLNARRNNYPETKSNIEFFSQFAKVNAKFFSTIFILPTESPVAWTTINCEQSIIFLYKATNC